MTANARREYEAEILAARGDRERLAIVIGRFAREIAELRLARLPRGIDLESAIQDATMHAIVNLSKWEGKVPINAWACQLISASLANSSRSQIRWRRKHSQMPEAD